MANGERMYLHRRATGKLIWPGHYDCWAGGVIGPGEEPHRAADRELAEELDICGVPLTPIGCFPVRRRGCALPTVHLRGAWDGPVRHQPEEIVWGEWITLDELRARLADPQRWPFVPDGRAAIERWLAVPAPHLPADA